MNKPSTSEVCDPSTGCCSPSPSDHPSGSIVRRDFLKAMGLASGGLLLDFPAFGALRSKKDYTIPVDKGLSARWYKSLYERGVPERYSGKELAYIGMPIGGLFAGTVYLGGDGKLWLWDIFNEQKEGVVSKTYENWQGKQKVRPRDGANYIFPVSPEYPFGQGFGLKIKTSKKEWKRSLDFKGFERIHFKGQYPVAEVTYQDAALPVSISLESFSPFVPLDVAASSYPATVMQFKITNESSQKVEVELSGWLQNAVLTNTAPSRQVTLLTTVEEVSGHRVLHCSAQTEDQAFLSKPDFGTMALLLLNDDGRAKADAGVRSEEALLFPVVDQPKATAVHGEQLFGALSKTVALAPRQSEVVTFIVSWYFPNLRLPQNDKSTGQNKGRFYKNRFKSAQEAGLAVAENFQALYQATMAWRKVFYEDSTLPHWLLNRTFINTSILATETCFLLEDGRFWAWEGIGCCPGTCTHVWHYAQAMGWLFPELEKNLREKTDFAVINATTGGVDFRGALAKQYAADGQAGVVLRAYRDYLLSTDDTFLRTNWLNIKLALQYLINLDKEDGEANGTIFGEQHNTLDAEWYGNIPVITSLYLAALSASVQMAQAMQDIEAENMYRGILGSGQVQIEQLFNGEFFIQKEDPAHKEAIGIGAGCYIDQVFGQGWAHQVGLGRLFNKTMIHSALESLWKYNFVPDVGPLRASLSPAINGRPYAVAGDAGLIMCTWPLGGKKQDWEKHWQYGYFNECMTGFEHQVASHMVWEDKLDYGLAIERAIHERYAAHKRNPYNEIECSDHYARAMASYGVYIAACGFSYNGPKGQLAFEPKLNPDDFTAAFTAAEGWGSLRQSRAKSTQTNTVTLAHGLLNIRELTVAVPKGKTIKGVVFSKNGEEREASFTQSGNHCKLHFEPTELQKSEQISIIIRF